MPASRRDLAELRAEAAATRATPDIHLMARVELPPDDLYSFAFSPDGRTLLTAGHKTGLDFWDVTGHRHLSSVKGLRVSESLFGHAVYLPDGQGIDVGTRDHGVVFTDTQGVRTIHAPITLGSSRPTKQALSADGRRIAVAWTDGAGITVQDVAGGDLLDRFKDSAFALSPDGRWLARPEDSEIVLRPIASGEPPIVLGRHGNASAMAFTATEPCSPSRAWTTPRCSGMWRSANNSALFGATMNEFSTWRSVRTASGWPPGVWTTRPGSGRHGPGKMSTLSRSRPGIPGAVVSHG
jgi:WD40 repeat protein